MPIEGVGWEFHIVRQSEQRRDSDHKRRTIGKYQVFRDGVAQIGVGLSGTVAETRGPAANRPAGNGRRIETGRYPLATQNGGKYVTHGYKQSESTGATPKPGLELLGTDERSEILIHPGQGFLASVGCINPCTRLPNKNEHIDYKPSRKRVIAIIEDLKNYLEGEFPAVNGKKIPRAFVVVDGDPSFP